MEHLRASGVVTADDEFVIMPPTNGVPLWTLYLGMHSSGMAVNFADVTDLRRLRDALVEAVPDDA